MEDGDGENKQQIDDSASVVDSKHQLKRPSKRSRPNKFAVLGGSLSNPSIKKLLQMP